MKFASLLISFLGALIFFYGGYDDSPGAEAIGATLVLVAAAMAVYNSKQNIKEVNKK